MRQLGLRGRLNMADCVAGLNDKRWIPYCPDMTASPMLMRSITLGLAAARQANGRLFGQAAARPVTVGSVIAPFSCPAIRASGPGQAAMGQPVLLPPVVGLPTAMVRTDLAPPDSLVAHHVTMAFGISAFSILLVVQVRPHRQAAAYWRDLRLRHEYLG